MIEKIIETFFDKKRVSVKKPLITVISENRKNTKEVEPFFIRKDEPYRYEKAKTCLSDYFCGLRGLKNPAVYSGGEEGFSKRTSILHNRQVFSKSGGFYPGRDAFRNFSKD